MITMSVYIENNMYNKLLMFVIITLNSQLESAKNSNYYCSNSNQYHIYVYSISSNDYFQFL
jgi:hypothetical protein